MSNINEIKDMLDKLNEELEILRTENAELKLRLAKYETIGNYESTRNTDITIEEMDLTVRSYNCLANAGIMTVADILKCNAKRLYGIQGLGIRSRREVIKKMQELGFDDWACEMQCVG